MRKVLITGWFEKLVDLFGWCRLESGGSGGALCGVKQKLLQENYVAAFFSCWILMGFFEDFMKNFAYGICEQNVGWSKRLEGFLHIFLFFSNSRFKKCSLICCFMCFVKFVQIQFYRLTFEMIFGVRLLKLLRWIFGMIVIGILVRTFSRKLFWDCVSRASGKYGKVINPTTPNPTFLELLQTKLINTNRFIQFFHQNRKRILESSESFPVPTTFTHSFLLADSLITNKKIFK